MLLFVLCALQESSRVQFLYFVYGLIFNPALSCALAIGVRVVRSSRHSVTAISFFFFF